MRIPSRVPVRDRGSSDPLWIWRVAGVAAPTRDAYVTQSNNGVVADAIRSCRRPFVAVAGFSGVVNVLMLAGSLYMLQVYDRVLSSKSIPTLLGLSFLLLVAYLLQGYLDSVRTRMLARIGARFDRMVSDHAFRASQRLPLVGANAEASMAPLRDLDQIRAFLSSMGPTAFFDMPWMPVFFVGCYLLHPALGLLALVGGVVIVGITAWTDRLSKVSGRAQSTSGAARMALADSTRRNAEAVAAMGMGDSFLRRWREANGGHVGDWLRGADVAGGIGSFAKVFRMILQSAVLGLGSYLVIKGELSGGAMIAASIMTSRALAPIEIAVAHWKAYSMARAGLVRLTRTLDHPSMSEEERTELPSPRRDLVAEGLSVAPPGHQSPILNGVSLSLVAGDALAIIGPSASGKSTLARALVGVWRPMRGTVRIDGASLDQWPRDGLGRHVGYLPQDVELFEGTVAENISRFDRDADDSSIVSAAVNAGAHEMIVRLERGYDTRVGEGGLALSGGQRQRLGLARALYGDPFLVVLDEPNANLDKEGDVALAESISRIRVRRGICVVVTHRTEALSAVTHIAVLGEGRIHAFGPRDEVLKRLQRPAPQQREAVR